MRFEMKMPDLAATESEIRIGRWLIAPGEKIERGQPLLEVETDKAAMEVESPVGGVLADILFPEDEAVSVGQVIAVIEVEGTQAGENPAAPAQAAATEKTAPAQSAVDRQRPAAAAAGGMFARNRAAAASASEPSNSAAGIPLSAAQRTAAKRLQQSKQTIPHFYLQTSINAESIIRRREAAAPNKPAWDAFFVRAVAEALDKFDRFRRRIEGERLVTADTDAVGVAVDVDDELYVIPVAAPLDKTVEQISREIRRTVQAIRDGDPEARRIRPALFTVTNLGIGDVENFIPIINPPEAAILGVGKVAPTPKVVDGARIEIQQRCTITLCVDHRITSGKYASGFLAAIVEELESIE